MCAYSLTAHVHKVERRSQSSLLKQTATSPARLAISAVTPFTEWDSVQLIAIVSEA